MRHRRAIPVRAFTMLEMLIVVTVLAIIIAMAVPRFTSDDRLRLRAAASLIISDVEFAQTMSIGSPNDPVKVTFDAANDRYWLSYSSAPNDPIVRPDTGETYLVVLGVGRAIAAEGVSFTTSGMKDGSITFNAQGGLADFSSTPVVTVSTQEDQSIEIAIAPTTGTIREKAK